MATDKDLTTVMALDIGEVRTGVAIARAGLGIATPLQTLASGKNIAEQVASLVQSESVTTLVIGLPRNLQGNPTDQTRYVDVQAAQIKRHVSVPVYFVDEALTSVKAHEELKAKGMQAKVGQVDMLAATYILEDFLSDHREAAHV